MTADVSGSFTVRDSRAAQVLLDVRVARLLNAFLDEARTVASVARELDEDLDGLLYRVKRLVTLGLLRREGDVERKGRAMRTYRATARAFFVPFDVTTYETLEAYLEGVEHDVATWVRRNVVQSLTATGDTWGLRVARGEDGQMHSKLAPGPEQDLRVSQDGPALLSFVYPNLRLDFEDAKAMQQDLMEVFRKYAEREGAQPYLLQVVLCPITVPVG